jgi:5-methylcytosine-specific restriction endonuclease McrA
MTAFHYDDGKGAQFFAGHVERIYGLFATLSPCQVEQLRLWYRANNSIEQVCANDPMSPIKRYEDFPVELKKTCDQLGAFFKGLYSNLDLAPLRKWIGNIDDHYEKFMKRNTAGKCPFCGINDLLGEYHSKREAYDHYLPKALYPFNSINFRNLVPACHHCNSSYKTSRDPAYTPKDPARAVHRRAIFNPYKTGSHSIELQITLQHSDIAKLTPTDITLQFGPPAITQEIETWKDVYGIEERYRAKLCSADANDWIEQFRILNRRQTYRADEYIDDIGKSDPFANTNFLKKAFVQACEDIGLLAAIENYR